MVTAGDKNTIPHDVIITDSTLKQILGEPCEVQAIVGDDNCYYRCISVAVIGVQDH